MDNSPSPVTSNTFRAYDFIGDERRSYFTATPEMPRQGIWHDISTRKMIVGNPNFWNQSRPATYADLGIDADFDIDEKKQNQ